MSYGSDLKSTDVTISYDDNVKLWTDNQKTASIDSDSNIADGTEFYIEGISTGAGEITLEWESPETEAQYVKDIIKVYVIDVNLKNVTFSGTGFNAVSSDPVWVGGQIFHYTYSSLQWWNNPIFGITVRPISFERNSTMRVTTTWETAGVPANTTMWIRGRGTDDFDFDLKDPQTGNYVGVSDPTNPKVTNLESEKAFGSTVDFYDPEIDPDSELLEIQWEFSVDEGAHWQDAGTSENPVYITLGKPKAGMVLYQTVVALSSRGAQGKSDEAQAVQGIWGEFTSQDVKRYDDTPLKYYGKYTTTYDTVEELLYYADGDCTAWAKLFVAMYQAQGIDYTNEGVRLRWKDRQGVTSSGFLVNQWDFDGQGTSGNSSLPYVNRYTGDPVTPSGYAWTYEEVKDKGASDADNIAAQNNDNPASMFRSHVVVQIAANGAYYDPSYGVVYNTLQDFDNKLSGFYESDGSSKIEVKKNLPAGQLDIEPTQWFDL